MSFEQYRSKYLQFLISVHQAELITLAAGGALESFPANLPTRLKEGLSDAMTAVGEALAAAAKNDPSPGEAAISLHVSCPSSPAFGPLMGLYSLTIQDGRRPDELNFQKTLYRQQLVMLVAHTEAFFGDSIRAVCLAAPNTIESQKKQISWLEALSYLDREALRAALVESFVSDMTRNKGVKSFLFNVEKELKIDVAVEDETVDVLSTAEQARHIIVHNGGRIDARFLEKTKIQQPVGDEFNVSAELLNDVARASMVIAQAVFGAVASKHFSIDDPAQAAGIEIQRS